MLRAIVLACLLAVTNAHAAALQPAPFNQQAVDEIARHWNQTYPQFQAESAQYPGDSPEALVILAAYLHDAFASAGYSLDETLYIYLSQSNPGAIQMHQFASLSGLGAVILGLDGGGPKSAYLVNAEILSKRTYDYLRKLSTKVPIEEASYILEGTRGDGISGEGVVRNEFRKLGRLVLGEDEWDGWVVFKEGELINTAGHPVGVADLRTASADYREFVMSIVNQKRFLKIQGVTVRAPGTQTVFDETQDILILMLK
ncbi:hypothetical protein [Aquipseudomonas alcaligenes]|uniref:hypothetical protein n=1 Tax=Aquipseudomonas alcaligenes TaxID=43263 RepID=UPI003666B061